MKSLLSLISRVISSLRTVVERCARTGKWIVRTVVSPFAGGGGVPGTEPDDAIQPAAVPDAGKFQRIRDLAGAIATDRLDGIDISAVPDSTVAWLGAMDRGMLAKVICAKDEALADHIAGRRAIRGVLAADPASVDAYVNRVDRDDETDFVPQPVYGMAA